MCEKCEEVLAPVRAKIGEMTRLEEITSLAALRYDMPLDKLIEVLLKTRDEKMAGSLGGPELPDDVVESDRVLEMADKSMAVAADRIRAVKELISALGLGDMQEAGAASATSPAASAEPFQFNEETLETLLGFQLNAEQSAKAFAMAKAGLSLKDVFHTLIKEHPMHRAIKVFEVTTESGETVRVVSEAQFDEMMNLERAAAKRATSKIHNLGKLRASVMGLYEGSVAAYKAGGEHKGLAYQVMNELKVHLIDANPEAFGRKG